MAKIEYDGNRPLRDDGPTLLRRTLDADLEEVEDRSDGESRSVEVTASTEALDSHGTIIEQNFDLKRFRKNPVVLWRHNLEADPFFGSAPELGASLPIGRAENIRVEDGALKARLVFASAEASPLADRVFRLMKEKMLRGISIGFRRGAKTKITEETDANGNKILRISKAELLEISPVPIGSNPEAVSRGLEDEDHRVLVRAFGLEERSDEEETMTLEELKKALEAEQAKVRDLEAKLDESDAKATDFEQRCTALSEERDAANEARDAAVKRADELDAEAQKRDVDELLKAQVITPAEREHFEELRRSNPELFAKMIEARKPLALNDRAAPPDPTPTKTAEKSNGAERRLAAAALSTERDSA